MADEQKVLGFTVDASDGEGDSYTGDVEGTLDLVRRIITDGSDMEDGMTAFFLITRCDLAPGEIEALDRTPRFNREYAFRPVQINRDLAEACEQLLAWVEGLDVEPRIEILDNARDAVAQTKARPASTCPGTAREEQLHEALEGRR